MGAMGFCRSALPAHGRPGGRGSLQAVAVYHCHAALRESADHAMVEGGFKTVVVMEPLADSLASYLRTRMPSASRPSSSPGSASRARFSASHAAPGLTFR